LELLTDKLKDALARELPGADAQYLMAPFHRNRIEAETLKVEQYRPSAVMILFCRDKEDKLFIPLTERASYNGAHSAQISLPGGKYDESDLDYAATAKRECEEEIGIKEVEVIGKLTSLFIPVSSFLVHPFVGICPLKDPVMVHHEREVKTILRLYVGDLLNDKMVVQKGTIELFNNLKIETPWFDVNGYKVWGATAMILSELKQLMRSIA
jgi:8-oxo-dGTP pyrophosphatase MutT (NUDIX family)